MKDERCPALWTDKWGKHDCHLPIGHRGQHRCDHCDSILSKSAWNDERVSS